MTEPQYMRPDSGRAAANFTIEKFTEFAHLQLRYQIVTLRLGKGFWRGELAACVSPDGIGRDTFSAKQQPFGSVAGVGSDLALEAAFSS